MSTIPPDAILSQYPVPYYQQISTQANCEMQMIRQYAVLVHEMLIFPLPFFGTLRHFPPTVLANFQVS